MVTHFFIFSFNVGSYCQIVALCAVSAMVARNVVWLFKALGGVDTVTIISFYKSPQAQR